MNDQTHTPFPAVLEGQIGGASVQTVNGAELHSFLLVGKDFSTWVKARIASYGFIEDVDYVCSPVLGSKGSGGHNRLEYFVSIDMAKEISMVERNAQGKKARRYFIECERRLQQAHRIDKAAFGRQVAAIVDDKLAKAISVLIPSAVTAALAERTSSLRKGKTAGEILQMSGFRALKGLAPWLGNKLVLFDCQIPGNGCGELGQRKARLFDPDKAERWLKKGGGELLVKQKIAERQGQGVLHLVGKVKPSTLSPSLT